MLRRSGTKAYSRAFQEGTDDAVLDSIVRSTSGTANLWDDGSVTTITIGGGAANTALTMMGGSGTGTVSIGNSSAGAVTVDSGAGVSVDAGAASNFTTSAGALTLTSAAAATWSTAAGGLILDGAGGVQLQGNAGEIDLTTSGALDLNSGAYTLNCSTAVVTPSSTYDLEATGAIGIDSSAGISIGDTNATSISLGRTGFTTTIVGDLSVTGTTFTNQATNVLYDDNHLYLNNAYTTVSAQTGGLVVNYLPTSVTSAVTTGGFTAAVAATTNPTVKVVASAAFAVNDLIQVSGANTAANDGLYEVLSKPDATTLKIRNIGGGEGSQNNDFTQDDFTTDATVAGAVTKVTVSVLRAGTDGVWESGSGATGAISFVDLATAGGSTLQTAYVAGNAITMTDAEGNFDVSVTSGTPAISLDAAGASNFTVASANLSLGTTTSGDVLISTTTAGEIDLTSAGLMDFNAGANLDVDVTGSFDMLASTTFSIDGTGASNVSATSGALTVSTITSGDLNLTAAASVVITGAEAAADAVTVTASNVAGGIDINAGGTSGVVTINGGGACTITTAGINLAAGSSEIDLTTTGAVDINSAAATWDSTSTMAFEAATSGSFNVTTGALTLSTTTSGDLTLSTTTAGDILLNGAAEIDLTSAGIMDLNATGAFTLDTSAGFALEGATASTVNVTTGALTLSTTTSGDLTLSTTTAGDVLVSSAAEIDLTGVTVDVNGGTGGVTIDCAATADITLTAASNASSDIFFAAHGSGNIPFNADGAATLVGFTASDIIGALNELKATGGGSALETSYTAGAGGIAVSDAVYISAADTVLKADASTDTIASRFLGVAEAAILAAATGQIITEGPATARFDNGLTLAAGEEVYMSETAGNLTNVQPSTSGAVVQVVGYIKNASAYVTVTNPFAVIHLIRGARLIA